MEIFCIEILQDQYQNICSKQKRKQKAWNKKIHFPQQQNQHWTAPKRDAQVHIQEQGRSFLVVLQKFCLITRQLMGPGIFFLEIFDEFFSLPFLSENIRSISSITGLYAASRSHLPRYDQSRIICFRVVLTRSTWHLFCLIIDFSRSTVYPKSFSKSKYFSLGQFYSIWGHSTTLTVDNFIYYGLVMID